MAVVSADLIREWSASAVDALGSARMEIDALNVFPVPDGDTGTNLFLTWEAAAQAARSADGGDLAATAHACARGALMGARGNSGVISSQLLKGACDVLAVESPGSPLTGEALARMMRRASDLGYAAVARPVEGTILTVARVAAECAEAAVAAGASAERVMQALVDGAREALARTPEQLEALARAGVVDAGGRGLVIVLESLGEVVAGLPRPTRPPEPSFGRIEPADEATHHYGGPAYEVMFLLDADESSVAALRDALDRLGDSLVIVGDDGTWNVHVHVDDAGAAMEAGMSAGRPYAVKITHLEPVRERSLRTGGRGLVAVTHGDGVAAMLQQAEVVCIPAAAGTRPSTREILEAIEAAHTAEVVVLPSDKDTRGAADAAADQARLDGIHVAVIPTRSIVQTLAAVAVHDPLARFGDDVVAMTRAAGATRYAAVTVASRAALTTVGPCEPGDVLGLVDGDIVLIGDGDRAGESIDDVAREILRRMLAIGGELVTLVLGADADAGLRIDLPAWAETAFPLVDIVVHEGGQPLWPIIMGVE
jgi:DAK2 domain fusion protein YloV